MAATRVRVLLEFRNGDNHFLQLVQPEKPDAFVKCKGLDDMAALEKAFTKTLEEHLGRREAIAKMLALKHEPPSHD